jgi:hypothetical protein
MPKLISFVDRTQQVVLDEDINLSNRSQAGFTWEDLVKTLHLDIDVEWIEISKWGILFCQKIKPDFTN